jgi:hypothetical protein
MSDTQSTALTVKPTASQNLAHLAGSMYPNSKHVASAPTPFAKGDYDFLDPALAPHVIPTLKAIGITGRDQVQRLEALRDKLDTVRANAWADQSKRTLPPATIAAAQDVYAKFATPALREVLNTTGIGSHHGLLATFAAFGAALEAATHPGRR